MAKQLLELAFSVLDHRGIPLPADALHDQGAQLMGALLDLEKVNDDLQDPATASDADAGLVTVEMFVLIEDPLKAMSEALTWCRTAIHTIGGSTPHVAV